MNLLILNVRYRWENLWVKGCKKHTANAVIMCNILRTWWLSPLIWMTLWYKIFSNKSYLFGFDCVCLFVTFYSLAFLELSRGSQMVPTSTSVSWKLTESLRGTLIGTRYSILLGPNYFGDKFWVWTCHLVKLSLWSQKFGTPL